MMIKETKKQREKRERNDRLKRELAEYLAFYGMGFLLITLASLFIFGVFIKPLLDGANVS